MLRNFKKFDETSSEKRAMEVINKEGLYLNSLVDKLLNFTILGSGELQPNKRPVNLAEIVKKVLKKRKSG
ncbi:MAG: hypothetical protein QME68_01465 [Elusimicrobiota bacterium]|nr:hypothetical protein [Elusimicrobiota bacterium]